MSRPYVIVKKGDYVNLYYHVATETFRRSVRKATWMTELDAELVCGVHHFHKHDNIYVEYLDPLPWESYLARLGVE